MNKEIDKEMYKSMTGILKKINESDLEQLENMEIVPNDSERVHIKRGNGKLIFVVPKAYCYMLEQAIEQEIEKKRNLDKQYEAETEGTIEEIFWSGEKKARVSSTISDAKVGTTRSYLRKVKGEETRGKGENSKKERRNIKSEPKTISNKRYYDKEKKIRRILAAIAAGIVFFGGYIAWRIFGQNQPEPDFTTPPAHTDVLVPDETQSEYTETMGEKDKSEEVEDIDSINDVIDDFKERYIKEYNEKYGTDYSIYEIEIVVNTIHGGEVYELNDNTEIKHVTLGSTPAITLNELEGLGQVSEVNGYKEIIQIIVPDERGGKEHILGSYNVSTGEFIYSGNQLEDLRDSEFIPPTLEKLGINKNTLGKAAKVMLADGIEDRSSIEARIDDYEKTIRDEGFEPGD